MLDKSVVILYLNIKKLNIGRRTMNNDLLLSTIESGFAERYSNFKEFQTDSVFKPLWDLCMKTVADSQQLNIIVFCNDTYEMPPVKVFVDLNRSDIEALCQSESTSLFDENGRFKTYTKQSLGAFWGMVFRFGLLYQDRKSVFVVREKYFGISTASRFIK